MRRRHRRCACGAPVVWARDDGGRWLELDAQSTIDASVPGALVLWGVTAPGADQRASLLDDFERQHGKHHGIVWRLHFAVCPAADRPTGWPVTGQAPIAAKGNG